MSYAIHGGGCYRHISYRISIDLVLGEIRSNCYSCFSTRTLERLRKDWEGRGRMGSEKSHIWLCCFDCLLYVNWILYADYMQLMVNSNLSGMCFSILILFSLFSLLSSSRRWRDVCWWFGSWLRTEDFFDIPVVRRSECLWVWMYGLYTTNFLYFHSEIDR